MMFSDILAKYELLCFDFDGLLVDTETLHFLAYKKMLEQYGHFLSWDFLTYCFYSHANRHSLRDEVYRLFPTLMEISTDWEYFRAEKQIFYEKFLLQGMVTLMPGVEKILAELELSSCKRCVVTNSPNDHLMILKNQIPALQNIPVWIGRNEYNNPKPHPDPYLAACQHFSNISKNRIMAFEDSLKGSQSALAAGIDLIFICPQKAPDKEASYMKDIPHFFSFKEIL
jgi:HAD superfamily hydrolase (TIGR01509 family)